MLKYAQNKFTNACETDIFTIYVGKLHDSERSFTPLKNDSCSKYSFSNSSNWGELYQKPGSKNHSLFSALSKDMGAKHLVLPFFEMRNFLRHVYEQSFQNGFLICTFGGLRYGTVYHQSYITVPVSWYCFYMYYKY